MIRRFVNPTALAVTLVIAGACSSSGQRPEIDSAGDASVLADADVLPDLGRDTGADVECQRFCLPGDGCTFDIEPPNDIEFFFPPGLEPSEFGPVVFEDFEGANPAAKSTLTNPDPRWPSQYREGAFVPYGESFLLSMGMLAPMAQETSGPYRVFVSVWVDYEPVTSAIAAPMPGRQDYFFEGRGTRAVFEVPDFPVVIDLEVPAEALGDRGLHDLVVMYRVSTESRTHASGVSERFSIFYGGNQRVASHPCFVIGEPVPLTDQENSLYRQSHFFYLDEQSIPEQRDGFQETIPPDQDSIELTLASPPSRAPGLVEEMSEVLFIFRNEELLFREHVGRHSREMVDPYAALSRRRQVVVDLPTDEDRFDIWGFAIQHPYQPELDYETGAVDQELLEQVDAPGAVGTRSYRIRRE